VDKYKSLDEFYSSQAGDKAVQVEAIRNIILLAEPRLQETLKWNAPNFVQAGEDRLTMNLMNKEGKVKLVLHMGATRKEDKKADPVMTDTTGLIVWNSNIRGTITFESSQHISQVSDDLKDIVQQWLSIRL